MGFGSFARVSLVALSTSALVFAGCSGDTHLGPVPIQKSKIKITPSTLDLEALADLGQFTATRTDGQGRPSNLNHFVWRSLSPAVAQIDGAGRVVSLGLGTAVIEVSASGESARAEVVVDQLPVMMALGTRADTLETLDQELRLNLEARDRNGFRIPRGTFTWQSDDSQVVSVDDQGIIRSRREGRTRVRVRKKGRRDSTEVIVKPQPNIITIQPNLDTLKAMGAQVQLNATLTDQNGAAIQTSGFQWAVSESSVISVTQSGLVEAVGIGDSWVAAELNGLRGLARVAVVQSVEQVSISPQTAAIPAPGQTVQLTASGTDQHGTAVPSSAFSWSSDRPGVASVGGSGLVTGVGQGTATITATAPSGAKGFATVSVGQIRLNVAPKQDTLNAVGDQTQLAIYPRTSSGASASCPNPQWSSLNSQVASVNAQGVTTARAIGTAMIMVAACAVQDSASITVLGGGTAPPPPPPPPPPSNIVAPDLPRATPDTVRPTMQRTVRVNTGPELQAAVNGAQAGDEILLNPGGQYVVSNGLTLPARNDGGWVMIRTDMSLPKTRIDTTRNLAVITCSGSNCRTVRADALGDHGWWFEGIEIASSWDGQSQGVFLGKQIAATVPDRFVFDRVYIHAGQPQWNFRDCMVANASNVAVLRSVLVECHKRSDNSHAFGAWNTPGPILVYDNQLSAATIPFLLGGGDPRHVGNIPSDVVVARNHVWRPNSWKGGPWVVKNLLELKIGIRVHIWGNVFENHWRHAQAGDAIVLKTANQSCGFGDFSETAHVTFERNILRNVDMGIRLAPDPTNCGVDMHDVLIQDVVCEQCGPNGTNGDQSSRNFRLVGPTDNLVIRRYTNMGANMHTALEIASSNQIPGRTLLIENVLFRGPTGYGIRKKPISDTYTNYTFANAYAVGDNCQKFEAGWTCPGSAPPGAGANMAAVNAATSGVKK